MGLLFVFAVVIWCIAGEGSAQNRRPSSNDGYVLVFSDEFNQRNWSQPDPTKWRVPQRDSNVRWKRWVSNSPKVAFIKNGSLVCRAIPNRSASNDTARILTGAVDTRHTFTFQYGKVEVRMKTNIKEGNSPAAWLFVDKRLKNPRYGEIDIFESFGNRGTAHQAVHTHQTWILKKKGVKHEFSIPLNVKKWHVYGLEWTPDKLIWTIDGIVVAQYTKSNVSQQLEEGQWTFDNPFFILLNQSLYGLSKINSTYETYFDWIRVYQKK